MKKILQLLSVLLMLCGCGSTFNQPSSNGNSLPATKSGGEIKSVPNSRYSAITSESGYAPTQEDVSQYKNDVGDFLMSNVKSFSSYRKAMILVDGKEADTYSGIGLSRIKNIAVMDPSRAGRTYGPRAGYGAIVIRTK